MTQALEPGLYHIRSVDLDHLPTDPGGKYARSTGEGNPVKVEALRSPNPPRQIFNVRADPEIETYYEILLHNPSQPTFALSGWSYAEDGVGEPITINFPKSFQIQPVEGADCAGIYL